MYLHTYIIYSYTLIKNNTTDGKKHSCPSWLLLPQPTIFLCNLHIFCGQCHWLRMSESWAKERFISVYEMMMSFGVFIWFSSRSTQKHILIPHLSTSDLMAVILIILTVWDITPMGDLPINCRNKIVKRNVELLPLVEKDKSTTHLVKVQL